MNIKTKLLALLLLCSTFFTFTAAPVLAAVSYLYDPNGNMISDGTNCYTYNEFNNLTQVKNCSTNQVVAQYVYDDQGNRIIQKIYQNGVLAQTVYTPTTSYETTKVASTGALQNTTYFWVDGQIAARKNQDGTKTYYHNDNLNSTNLLTNQSGSVVEKTTYYPFGGIQTGGTQSKFLYTGQKQDSESGLDYYNARYYNPQIRRFTQPDDIYPEIYNPQSLNRYSYVINNPLRYTDRSGHQYAAAIGASLLDPFFGLLTALGIYTYTNNNTVRNVVNNLISYQISSQVLPLQLTLNAVKNISTQNKSTSSNSKPTNISNSSKGPNQNPFQKIAPAIPPSFASANKLLDHFNRHASDLGLNTIDEYLQGARNLFNGGDGVGAAIRQNGDAIFIKESTNEFGILTPENTIRTYFRANGGLDYFLRQLSK